jgi:hypothetical protein
MYRSIFLAIVVLAAMSTNAFAEDYRNAPAADAEAGIELTPWLRVMPHARHSTSYVSNIFGESNSNKRDDVVFRTLAGLDVRAEDDKARYLEIGYAITGLLYARFGGLDTVEHFLRWGGGAEFGKLQVGTNGYSKWGVSNSDPQFLGRIRNVQAQWGADVEYQPIDLVGVLVDGSVNLNENFPEELQATNSFKWRGGAWATVTPNTPIGLKFEGGGEYREIIYYDRTATNPDLWFVSGQLGVGIETDIIQGHVRAGYEAGFSKDPVETTTASPGLGSTTTRKETNQKVVDGLILDGDIGWTIQESTQLTVYGTHQIDPSSQSAFARHTTVGASITQDLPADFHAFASASWDKQEPGFDISPTLRTQSFMVGAGWQKWDVVEVGAQVSYIRTKSRITTTETFTTALSITLRY